MNSEWNLHDKGLKQEVVFHFLTQTQTANAFERFEDVEKRKKKEKREKENLIISFDLAAVPPIVLPRMACTATRR